MNSELDKFYGLIDDITVAIRNCTSPTGRHGSGKRMMPVTAPQTILASHSLPSTCMRRSSWKSTSRSPSFCSSWPKAG